MRYKSGFSIPLILTPCYCKVVHEARGFPDVFGDGMRVNVHEHRRRRPSAQVLCSDDIYAGCKAEREVSMTECVEVKPIVAFLDLGPLVGAGVDPSGFIARPSVRPAPIDETIGVQRRILSDGKRYDFSPIFREVSSKSVGNAE